MNLVKKIKNFLLDTIFPIFCLGCGVEGVWLCQACEDKIEINSTLTCPLCRASTNGHTCKKCASKTYLDGLLVATAYEATVMQTLIKTLKYHYAQETSEILANVLARFLTKIDKKYRPDILQSQTKNLFTSVPLHKKRLLERGFNQSDVIARQLKKKFLYNYQPNLLWRKRYTDPQAKLKRKKRLSNLANAFSLSKSFDLKDKNVIIIDDVATTLTTLNECAKVLKQTNCREVWGLVIAHGN